MLSKADDMAKKQILQTKTQIPGTILVELKENERQADESIKHIRYTWSSKH